jgi:hypothetical protein
MDSGGYDMWNPDDGPSGAAGNEAGDGSSPSDAANDAGDGSLPNDAANDAPSEAASDAASDGPGDGAVGGGCTTNADCNDGGFGADATMWCNHHDDNLTYTYPDGGMCRLSPERAFLSRTRRPTR